LDIDIHLYYLFHQIQTFVKCDCRSFTQPRAWRCRLHCGARPELSSSVVWFDRCQAYSFF